MRMRIVLAPDSFKESMTAATAAAAMARGVTRVWPAAECRSVPVADGGEGTLEVLAAALGAEVRTVATTDPLGRPVAAAFGIAGEVAIIEVATAIGLELVSAELRDIERASTIGLAKVFVAALDAGVSKVIVGIGGTATCDGGAGLLVGLGARLLDAAGVEVRADPAGLTHLDHLDLSGLEPRLASVHLEIAGDVTNPLLGATGAAAVFAPQKGARADQLPGLEAGLARLAEALVAAGLPDVRDLPGAGAGGGLGGALLALGARLRSGAEVVGEATGLDAAIAGADLVLTGEGSLDAQTASGKAVSAVVAMAARHRVPVIAFAGRIADPEALAGLGLAAAVAIAPVGMPNAEAVRLGPRLLEDAVAATLATWPRASQ
jgi:glycerate kinase